MPFVSASSQRNAFGKQNVFGGCINTWADSSAVINIADSADFAIDTTTQPFTIEFFVYRSSSNTVPYFFEKSSALALYISSGNLVFQLGATGYVFGTYTAINQWSHIAICRDSSSDVRVFVDGIQNGSTLNIPNTSSSSSFFTIGHRTNPTSAANSSRSLFTNFRFIKGTALYTSNFTKPIAPLTDVTDTKLLLNASNQTNFISNSSASSKLIFNNRCIWDSKTPFS